MLRDAGLPEAKLPLRSAWSGFWSQFKNFLQAARRRTAANGANEGAFDAAIDLIRQLAFELADSDTADPKDVKNLVSLLLKHKDQAIKEREVGLAERRLALLEQRKEARKTPGSEQLTPEQRERRIREIFDIRS
jgi:hypothetical protein